MEKIHKWYDNIFICPANTTNSVEKKAHRKLFVAYDLI